MALPHYHRDSLRVARFAGLLAARAGAARVEPEHLLAAFVSKRGILNGVLATASLGKDSFRREARQIAGMDRPARRSKPRISRRMEQVLLNADTEASSFHARTVEPLHLLLAITREPGPAGQLLLSRFGSYASLRRIIREIMHIPAGQCRVCGYDLRATPVRCPECGTEVC